MKSYEIYNVTDELNGLIYVADLLRMDGYGFEAEQIDKAVETMDELLERLRADVANSN